MSGICSLFPESAQKRQREGYEHHGGDEKAPAAENYEAEHGGDNPCYGIDMVLCAEPLLNKNRDKKRGQRKVNALKADFEHGTERRTEHGPYDPVYLVKEGHEKIVIVLVYALGQFFCRRQGNRSRP